MIKLFAAFFLFVLFISNTEAQIKDLNFKLTHQIIETQAYDIGDIVGHSIGVAKGTGLGYFEDEGVAVLTAFFIFDYTNGSGNFDGYYAIEMADGSEITMYADGKSIEYTDEKKTIFTADIKFLNGTGKYSGITGSGQMTGQRKNRVEEGAPVFLEVVSTYELK